MTKLLHLIATALRVFVVVIVVAAPGRGQEAFSLEEVLNGMAEAGREFETLEARVERDEVNGLINRHYRNSGEVYFGTIGDDMQIRVNISEPESARQELLVAGGLVQNYNPRTNQVEQASLGDRADIVAILAVGFGPANALLDSNFEIGLVGEEDLDGVPTSLIELIPLEEEFLRFAETIRLWVDHDQWIPLQQGLQPPGVNYVIIKYSAVKLNEGLPDSTWDLDLPDDVEVLQFR